MRNTILKHGYFGKQSCNNGFYLKIKSYDRLEIAALMKVFLNNNIKVGVIYTEELKQNTKYYFYVNLQSLADSGFVLDTPADKYLQYYRDAPRAPQAVKQAKLEAKRKLIQSLSPEQKALWDLVFNSKITSKAA